MTIHPIARIAANLGRMYPVIGRDLALRLARRYGVPIELLTLARVLACAERNHI